MLVCFFGENMCMKNILIEEHTLFHLFYCLLLFWFLRFKAMTGFNASQGNTGPSLCPLDLFMQFFGIWPNAASFLRIVLFLLFFFSSCIQYYHKPSKNPPRLRRVCALD